MENIVKAVKSKVYQWFWHLRNRESHREEVHLCHRHVQRLSLGSTMILQLSEKDFWKSSRRRKLDRWREDKAEASEEGSFTQDRKTGGGETDTETEIHSGGFVFQRWPRPVCLREERLGRTPPCCLRCLPNAV